MKQTSIVILLFIIVLQCSVGLRLITKLDACQLKSVNMAQCQKCISDESELVKIINNKCEIEE